MKAVILSSLLSLATADVYMHNPRGSNNRVSEANTNRNNANRLFDSQNNGKGGYCLGPPMGYYETSELTIEWTAQHSCGGEGKADCNVVLQYMCTDTLVDTDASVMMRDGTTTDQITTNNYMTLTAASTPDNPIYEYGMHESYNYFLGCQTRDRNQGLYRGDEQINGNSARFTRQNENGNTNGFECAEERDYYPYWHPQPWVDIAVLTSNTDLCDWYEDESQNGEQGTKTWGWCHMIDANGNDVPASENNENACNVAGYNWTTWSGHGVDAPDCLEHPWQRDNHLGNAEVASYWDRNTPAMHTAHYNWTLPSASDLDCIETESCMCVLRMRYNMSSWEIDGFGPGGALGDLEFHTSAHNDANAPFTNDPYVEFAEGVTLRLEMNTNQYGRVFQDRSHIFNILKRPSILPGSTIFNLNVRGKRGNIVQAYPAVEYDFVPTALHVHQYDYIHFQWTGCDNNPAGNAGQGTDGTDRSNMVQMAGLSANMPCTEAEITAGECGDGMLFDDSDQRKLMAYLGQNIPCTVADPDDQQDPANCHYLNAASPYFNGGLLKMNATGTYYFMSTRNNNFSNRSHKGSIVVHMPLTTAEFAGVIIGASVFVILLVFAILLFYGKSHPHSAAGKFWNKMPWAK